ERDACRKVIDDALESGAVAYELLTQLIWPTMELIQTLYREDRINISSLNMATRLNRAITDQLCSRLTRKAANGRKVLIFCGNDKRAEGLAEEIGADLFAPDAATAVQTANEHPNRKASVDQQTVGRTRRIRKAAARKAEAAARGASETIAEAV